MPIYGVIKAISNDQKQKADANISLFLDYLLDLDAAQLDSWWDQLWFIYDVWMRNHNITDVSNPSYQRENFKTIKLEKM